MQMPEESKAILQMTWGILAITIDIACMVVAIIAAIKGDFVRSTWLLVVALLPKDPWKFVKLMKEQKR